MRLRSRMIAASAGLAIAGIVGVGAVGFADPGGGPTSQRGMCGGAGMGPGGGHGGDMRGIHSLFANRDQIHRTVTQISGGVRTTTESDDPAVVVQLREHVQAMYSRLKEHRPINTHDPAFAATNTRATSHVSD